MPKEDADTKSARQTRLLGLFARHRGRFWSAKELASELGHRAARHSRDGDERAAATTWPSPCSCSNTVALPLSCPTVHHKVQEGGDNERGKSEAGERMASVA